ncbi:MAG: hypothetical protein ACBZ72_00735 [Candidatus Bathyarchaeia archaeon]
MQCFGEPSHRRLTPPQSSLGVDPGDPDIMERKPGKPKKHFTRDI